MQKSQTNASRKKHKHTATKPQTKKIEISNFLFFPDFFFMKEFLLILTKQKWRENNESCEFKKNFLLIITNYQLFDVSSPFFAFYARDTTTKPQRYSKHTLIFLIKIIGVFLIKNLIFDLHWQIFLFNQKKNNRIFFSVLKTRQWRFNFKKKSV